MKISKTAVLIGGFLTTGLGLTCVSGVDLYNLKINEPDNLVQHITGVKIIESGNAEYGRVESTENLVNIETNNFVLSKDKDSNKITTGNHSSILGGSGNTITGDYSVIVGGENNRIEGGISNSILGGMENRLKTGENSVIIGGEYNTLEGSNSSIVGGTGNTVNGDYSVVVGNNSHVTGSYSVVMGQNSNLNANSSFLWTDGGHTDSFTTDNVFAVIASGGMVINATRPHNEYTQLTLGGPLVLSENTGENNSIICSNGQGGGIVKVVNSGDKVCMCSCDGYERSSLFGLGTCRSVCNPDIKPKCNTGISKHWDEIGQYNYYSGGCDSGNVVDGAYFVDKYNRIHWSCQSDDGAIEECIGSGSDIVGGGYEGCGGEKPEGEHVRRGPSTGLDNNVRKQWTFYDNKTNNDLGICEWSCESGYRWDINTCVEQEYSCKPGDLPSTEMTGIIKGASKYLGNNYQPQEWKYIGLIPFRNLTNNACYWSCKKGTYDQIYGICIPPNTIKCTGTFPSDVAVLNNSKVAIKPYKYQDLRGDGKNNDACTYHCKEGYSYSKAEGTCVQTEFDCEGKPGTGDGVITGNSKYKIDTESWTIPPITGRTYTGGTPLKSCEWTCMDSCTKVLTDSSEEGCDCGGGNSNEGGMEELKKCIWKNGRLDNISINNNFPPSSARFYHFNEDKDDPCSFVCEENYYRDEDKEQCKEWAHNFCDKDNLSCKEGIKQLTQPVGEYLSDEDVILYKWDCDKGGGTPGECDARRELSCKHCAKNGFSYCFPIDFSEKCNEVERWEKYNLNSN